MTVDIDHLWDKWDECQEKSLNLSLDEFLVQFVKDANPSVVAEFRRQVQQLEKLDARIGPLHEDISAGKSSTDGGETSGETAITDLWPGAEPIPGYRLISRLGQGGFGEVWKAMGPGGFPVALKFLRLSERAAQIEERSLDLLKQLRHPHLLAMFGTWRQDGYLIIASELADRTLQDRFKEAQGDGEPGVPRDELLGYIADAAEALDFLNNPPDDNRPRIQHRDIKPENIFLSGGAVKIGDLGLIRAMEGSVTGHTGSMTLAYAAPEFINGQTSDRSDQYSLAVTYCFLRTGELPFTGNHAQVMAGHLHGEPNLMGLPEAERPIVAHALAKAPRDRWPSCQEFMIALRQAGHGSRHAGSVSLKRGWHRPVAKRRWLVAAGAAVAVLAVGLGVWATTWMDTRRESAPTASASPPETKEQVPECVPAPVKPRNATPMPQVAPPMSQVAPPMPHVGGRLVGHWTFDEGEGLIAEDRIGDDDGRLNNGPTWGEGRFGNGLWLDGKDDFVAFPSRDFGSQFTVSLWIKPETLERHVCVLSNDDSGVHKGFGIRIGYRGGKLPKIVVNTGNPILGAGARVRTVPDGSGGVIAPNRWQHVAVAFDRTAGVATVWLDGELVVEDEPIDTGFVTSGKWRLGTYVYTRIDDPFCGGMDDLRVYTGGLDTAEVRELIPDLK